MAIIVKKRVFIIALLLISLIVIFSPSWTRRARLRECFLSSIQARKEPGIDWKGCVRDSDSIRTVLSAIWDIISDPELDDTIRGQAGFAYVLFADGTLILSSWLSVSTDEWFRELDLFMDEKQGDLSLSPIEKDVVQQFVKLREQRGGGPSKKKAITRSEIFDLPASDQKLMADDGGSYLLKNTVNTLVVFEPPQREPTSSTASKNTPHQPQPQPHL